MKNFKWMQFLSLLIVGVSSFPAFALTGDQLLHNCSTAAGSSAHKQCQSYISGVVDGINTLTTSMKLLHPEYPKLFCVTSSVSMKSLVSAVAHYLVRNPGKGHYGAASEVVLALEGAFPCTS